ncbi:MAG: glycine zipper 2TM domain-containing protein, partial [Pseudoxanthomonas suwonensis]|nr:glycine zipper 2TM domain-containing protein [Pseudoxanthomonas suwonensis]
YGNDGYYGNDRYDRGGYYGNDGYRQGGSQAGRTMATVIGGIVGAAVGSQVGGGSARYATSAIGSMVGGMAGQQVYENSVRQRQPRQRLATVQVCDPVPGDGRYYGTSGNGVTAYDVTYEYAGRTHTTRMNHHPGERVRVRVDVAE